MNIDFSQFSYFIHKTNRHGQKEVVGVIYSKEEIEYGQIVYSDISKSDIGTLWSSTKDRIAKKINDGIYEVSKEYTID